jgi:putative membrane protein
MLGPAAIAHWALATQTARVAVEGLENVPTAGPVLLVARHVHHLLDGAVLVRYVPRPVHIVVALDWAADANQRRWMERACRAARYPVVLRPATLGHRGGFAAHELLRYTRSGIRDAVALLCEEHVVAIFPEGYPNVDPTFARKLDDDEMLPFGRGFERIAALAERTNGARVAIVPVGFRYVRGRRWSIRVRFGVPERGNVDEIAERVRELSE